VGMKNPASEPRFLLNRGLDVDVIVSEVRETSRKPDEIYGVIDRLSPGTRKLELFGRAHNTRAGWFTLGNQLEGIQVVEEEVVGRYNQRYPEQPISLTPLSQVRPKTKAPQPARSARPSHPQHFVHQS